MFNRLAWTRPHERLLLWEGISPHAKTVHGPLTPPVGRLSLHAGPYKAPQGPLRR